MPSPLCGCNDQFGLPLDTGVCEAQPLVCRSGELVVLRECYVAAGDARSDYNGAVIPFVGGGVPVDMSVAPGVVNTTLTYTNDTCFNIQTTLDVGLDVSFGVGQFLQDIGFGMRALVNGALWAFNGNPTTTYQAGSGVHSVSRNYTIAGPVIAPGATVTFNVIPVYIANPGGGALTGIIGWASHLRIWGGSAC